MSVPNTRGRVEIDDAQCRGCGLCVLACPTGSLGFADEFNDQGYHPVRFLGEGCRADGLCANACPRPGAIRVFPGRPDERDAA